MPCGVNDKQEIMYINIEAMCTYPFFKTSSKIVNMGAISIGDCKKKKLKVENCSPVSSMINIESEIKRDEDMFRLERNAIQRPLKINFDDYVIKRFNIPKGTTSVMMSDLIAGPLPGYVRNICKKLKIG